MKILRSVLKKDVAAVGVVFMQEDIGDGAMSNLEADVSLAYHKAFGASENHFISLGYQAGIIQRRAGIGNYSLPDEWVPGVGPVGETAETFFSDNSLVIDMNAGLFWYSFIAENSSVFAGFSSFHLLEPKESFLQDDEARIPRRYVGHGGSRIGINDNIYLIPNVIYVNQGKAQDLIGGTSVEYSFENASVNVGGWYKLGESVILSLGFDIAGIGVGVSYDFADADLAESESKAGFEISLNYVASMKKVVNLKANPGKSY